MDIRTKPVRNFSHTLTKPHTYSLQLSCILLTIFIYGTADATNYYVDNIVSTSGNGSIAAPFKTIQEGINHLASGDTLWLRGNAVGRIYRETPSLLISGTASQPVTVKAYPDEKVILTGTSGTRLTIDQDHWIFDGLIIDQAGLAADAVRIKAQHITIKNVEIRNGQREGVSIEDAAFVSIEDSYIHDFMWIRDGQRIDAHCIVIDTDRSPNLTDIKIHHNTIERCSGDGVQIFGTTGQSIATYAKNIEFIDNTFIDGTIEPGLTENALDFKAADTVMVRGNTMTGYHNNKTIVVQKGCRNITIENNIISHGLSGIEMRQEGGIKFIQKDNSIIGNIVHHMSTYALKFDGVVNATVLNNTLAYIGTNSFRFESTLGSSVPSLNGGVIKNNLIYIAGRAPRVKGSMANVDVGYNGWFQANAGGLSRGTDTTGTEPLFVGPTMDNYNLQSPSAGIDAGIPVGLAFFGTAPDLGALEFNSNGDTIPPAIPRALRVLD